MKRRIIKIDEEKCNGCGACAAACHEGAIGMVQGKAKLLRDDYCDGLGDCLPTCPTGAISFEEREAADYNEAAVQAHKARKVHPASIKVVAKAMNQSGEAPVSHLGQWPCQLKLAPLEAPYYQGARLLIAADCSAFARADFHERFMKGAVTLIGCPKLDGVDYGEKLSEILRLNDIRSIDILRMEVPCCGGLAAAVRRAIAQSGKDIPCRTIILGTKGQLAEN